jgi:hypothetical protein
MVKPISFLITLSAMGDSQKGRRRWNQALQRVHAIENQIAESMRDQSAVVAPPREKLANKLQNGMGKP